MKIESNLYTQTKNNSNRIAELATQLEVIGNLEQQKVLVEGKIRSGYEDSCLRDIKNLLSNIYLMLDLHEIKGMADQIFNADFRPKD